MGKPHSFQKNSTFVNNRLDRNTNYNVEIKWVSTIDVLAMNTNSHIDSEQEVIFGAYGLDINTNYNVQM